MQASKLYNKANQMASDAFGACRTVAAFNLRAEIFRMYSDFLEAPVKESDKRCVFAGSFLGKLGKGVRVDEAVVVVERRLGVCYIRPMLI